MRPVLKTERLELRLPPESNLDSWSEIDSDPELRKYLGGVRSRAMTWRTIAMRRGSWPVRGYGMFSIRASGRWAGCWAGYAGPICPEGWPGKEVGWALARFAMGKGYATEAARRALDWVSTAHNWTSVSHCIHPDNAASIRVAERLGSHPIGAVALPEPFDRQTMCAWSQHLPAPRLAKRAQ